MENSDLIEARTNGEFLEYLEFSRVDAMQKENIALMYKTLDSMIVLDLDEHKINELYEKILQVSFENIDKFLEKNRKMKLIDNELLYVRGAYEHAIEKWSNDNINGAKEIFFILSNIVDDEYFINSLEVILINLAKNLSIDEFYDNFVSQEQLSDDEVYGYFLTKFNFDTQEYLKENSTLLSVAKKKLNYLLG